MSATGVGPAGVEDGGARGPAPPLGDAVRVERFRREVRLAARLQHPRIVPLLAAGALPDGVLFYTMPFVGAESGPRYAQHFDPRRSRVSGIPLRVLDRVASGRGSASYSAAENVLVSFDPTLPVVAPRVVWVDRPRAVVDSAVAPDSVRRVAASPRRRVAASHDGRPLALWGPGLWLYDRARRVVTRAHALAGPGRLVADAALAPVARAELDPALPVVRHNALWRDTPAVDRAP